MKFTISARPGRLSQLKRLITDAEEIGASDNSIVNVGYGALSITFNTDPPAKKAVNTDPPAKKAVKKP